MHPHHRKTDERTLQYAPRGHFLDFHKRDQRWACLVAHRRAGKTVACVNELIIRALYSKKPNPRYAYIAPYYSQAKDIAWTYLKHYAQPFIAHQDDIRESDLSVTLMNNSRIRLYGANNPDALRGIYLDGVILDEFGDCRPSLWGEIILPTLADRRGWAVFIGTPKGKNHFFQVHQRSLKEPNWYSMTLRADESGLLPPEEIQEMRAQMEESQAAQELDCDFTAAVLGTYYAAQIAHLEQNRQISPNPALLHPTQPTHVAFDIGYRDSTAIWFWQDTPEGPAFIDYEEAHSQPLDFYFNLLADKPYNYDTIWLPHDARAKTLQTGRSTVEQFLEATTTFNGSPTIRIAPHLKVQQGIDAVRSILPSSRFDLTRTEDGVEALRAYSRKYDEMTKTFSNIPEHNWASHGADAFRYAALVLQDRLPPTKRPRSIEERINEAVQAKTHLTLDELYEDYNRNHPQGRFGVEQSRIH